MPVTTAQRKRRRPSHTQVRHTLLERHIVHPSAHLWRHRQGAPGVNLEARSVLSLWGRFDPSRRILDCNHLADQGASMWYQTNLQALASPHTPFSRMLVAWNMGAGKTRGILSVLDNFYDDPRPKIFLSPTKQLSDNFYMELLHWPNRYQDFLVRNFATDVAKYRAKGKAALVSFIAKSLEYRGHQKNRMPGDLRAFTFNRAGCDGVFNEGILTSKGAMSRRSGGGPVGDRRRLRGSFDGCIILVDEAHLLFGEDNQNLKSNEKRALLALVDRLQKSDAVLYMFTGTPIVRGTHDISRFLSILKAGDVKKCNEGYVSYFMSRPPGLYARCNPPVTELPAKIDVFMHQADTSGLFQQTYKKIRFCGVGNNRQRCLGLGRAGGRQPTGCRPRAVMREGLMWDWYRDKTQCTIFIKSTADGHRYAPKLARIAQDVSNDAQGRKTLVMMHRESGQYTLQHLLHLYGVKHLMCLPAPSGVTAKERREHNDRNLQHICDFNAANNVMGENFRVLVLYEDYNQGVSVCHVRRIILADQTPGVQPSTWTLMQQRVARALRQCSHNAIPDESLRSLDIELYVINHNLGPEYAPTPDAEKYEQLRTEHTLGVFQNAYSELKEISIDGFLYDEK